MATSIRIMPAPALSEAKELDTQIRSAVALHHQSFARIAFFGWKLKLSNGFAELGYPSEYHYMKSLGIGRSRWFEAVAVGQALQALPLEELEKIPTEQALLLLSVKPEIKASYDWVKEAKTATYTDLAKKVGERNSLVPGPERVPMTPISFRVPAEAKESIIRNLVDFKERHELSSVGQALEFAVAEKTLGTTILAHLHEAIKLMRGVQASIGRRDDMENESKWLSLARSRVSEVYKMLLEANREDADEIHAEEVHPEEAPAGDPDDQGWQNPDLKQSGGPSGEAKTQG